MLVFLLTIVSLQDAPLLSVFLLFCSALVMATSLQRHGKRSPLAAGPLADLLLIVPFFLWTGQRFGGQTLVVWYSSSTLSSLGMNLVADLGLLWLASGRPLPTAVLPLRGIWARRLLASLCLLLAGLSPAPFSSWGLLPLSRMDVRLQLVAILLVGGPFALYVTPLWLELVHGWNRLAPAAKSGGPGVRSTDAHPESGWKTISRPNGG